MSLFLYALSSTAIAGPMGLVQNLDSKEGSASVYLLSPESLAETTDAYVGETSFGVLVAGEAAADLVVVGAKGSIACTHSAKTSGLSCGRAGELELGLVDAEAASSLELEKLAEDPGAYVDGYALYDATVLYDPSGSDALATTLQYVDGLLAALGDVDGSTVKLSSVLWPSIWVPPEPGPEPSPWPWPWPDTGEDTGEDTGKRRDTGEDSGMDSGFGWPDTGNGDCCIPPEIAELDALLHDDFAEVGKHLMERWTYTSDGLGFRFER